MKLFFTALCLMPVLAMAAEDSASFKIVHAGDQQVVTSESLDKEFQQVLALSQWSKAQSKLKMTQLRFEQAKRDLERSKQLRTSGTITESKFSMIYFEYRTLEVDMINLPIDVSKYKMTAQYHALRVVEEGNPGQDHRLAQAQLMLEGVDLEIQTLTKSLELAGTAKSIAETYVKSGEKLRTREALSDADMERRQTTLQSTMIHAQDLEGQIELAKAAREGFSRTIARLKQ